jgi:hypothetical protein
MAGERNLAAYLPRDRVDLHWLVTQRGFVRPDNDNREERSFYFYYWDRNQDVELLGDDL